MSQIIPHSSWVPTKAGYERLSLDIKAVTKQSVRKYGVEGVYTAEYKKQYKNKKNKKVAYSFEEFKQLATAQPVVESERAFWDSLKDSSFETLYADNINDSLFDEDCQGWNLRSLNDIMDRKSKQIEGVTDSYIYLGTPKAFFAWHVEDHYYYSISYLHFGAKKIWYSIPAFYAEKFERMFQGRYSCETYLLHKFMLADPEYIRRNFVPVYVAEQNEGEIIITFPRAYHAGFNCGFNCAEATNFATHAWIPFGINAAVCKKTCKVETFELNMDEIVKKNLPGNIDKYYYSSARDYFTFTFFVQVITKRGNEVNYSRTCQNRKSQHHTQCHVTVP